uniref:NADH dehydrogenase subunit 4L n=1 Tax=Megalophaedusa ishikawai TaxID=1885758 RepID=A0A224ABU4_9EUPU|nr:NADH dehydrogenase subunit 4L [Megalophaedusa ishikawai]
MLIMFTVGVLLVMLYSLFLSSKYHFLSCLLLFEALVLLSLLAIFFALKMLSSGAWVWFLILTFSVCEAALGLSLLMSYIKLSSTDLISSTSKSL